jgi:hypothetical protein
MLGSFSKVVREKLRRPALVDSVCLVDGKLAAPEALVTHMFLNPLLSKKMLEAYSKFAILVQIR